MYICGQHNTLSRIDMLVKRNSVPRFILIVAPTGYGKKVISEYIAKSIDAHFVPCLCDVESVRNAISASYEVVEKSLYMFYDCDDMSIAAKNALLKVTEEPPNNAYFIMTLNDLSNALQTIISRGIVLNLDTYSFDDLDNYIEHMKYDFNKKELSIIHQICTCPKDIQIVKELNIGEVYDTADKFIQFIGQANIANELKLSTLVNLKKDDGKIDPVIFLRFILMSCYRYIIDCDCPTDDIKVFDAIIRNTCKAICELSSKGCNKQMVFDNYIIDTHLLLNGGNL